MVAISYEIARHRVAALDAITRRPHHADVDALRRRASRRWRW